MNHTRKSIIFANPVRDLTLARYLAAMEVDYFGIDLDEANLQKTKILIQQIRDWVEGPKLIGVSATPSKNIAALFPLDGYYLDVEIELPKDSIIIQSHNYLLNHSDSNPSFLIVDNPEDCIENQNCILKTSIYSDLEVNSQIGGYMISPGREEKIGLYDFEKLEEWFGKMERMRNREAEKQRNGKGEFM